MVDAFALRIRLERMQTVPVRCDFRLFVSPRGLRSRRDVYVFFALGTDCRSRERTIERVRTTTEKDVRRRKRKEQNADIKSQSVHRVASDEVLVRVSESTRKYAVGVVPTEETGDREGVRVRAEVVRSESVRREEHGNVVETEA